MTKSSFTGRYNRFREVLVEARRAKHFTQHQLATKLNKPQSFVSKYERGERRLDVVEFLEIAEVLHMDPSAFLEPLALRGRKGGKPAKRTPVTTRWDVTVDELTGLIDENPSLRGMVLGYVAEAKLKQMWFSGKRITYLSKHDDHDRRHKGDHVISYKGHTFVVEAKSLQTNSIQKEGATWRGKAQVDASDRRAVRLPNGRKVSTTLLVVGEFDLLAVNCFAFDSTWRFVFARNSDLPRSSFKGYPPGIRKHLLASLVPISWPPEPPFHAEPFDLLDEILAERAGRDARRE